jgi:hypothetical protein
LLQQIKITTDAEERRDLADTVISLRLSLSWE